MEPKRRTAQFGRIEEEIMLQTQSRTKAPKTDPKTKHRKPPFEEPKQDFPGLETKMRHDPDHGEQSYRGAGRLAGRSALITGGDSGIGRAVALAFAREGADVAISYMPEEEQDAQQTRHWIEQAGQAALTLPGDIRDENHCRSMVDQVFAEQGKLDILVNNAAYQMSYGSIEEISAQEWSRTLATNLSAMFFLCKAAIPRMTPGSSIVNTSSIQAYEPNPTLLPYAMTKGAIVNFTKGLSKMVMKKGIRVNSVAPGPVWTPLIPSTLPKEKTKNFGGDTPFERAAQPAELAPLYVFLASEESSYVTGEVFGATGGRTPL
jgi:NAD(P)-dependent dehydrogenase (short-subunit alcohol dehydrogenase family)